MLQARLWTRYKSFRDKSKEIKHYSYLDPGKYTY